MNGLRFLETLDLTRDDCGVCRKPCSVSSIRGFWECITVNLFDISEKEAKTGDPSRVRVTGPLEAYASGFVAALTRVGYRRNPTAGQLRIWHT